MQYNMSKTRLSLQVVLKYREGSNIFPAFGSHNNYTYGLLLKTNRVWIEIVQSSSIVLAVVDDMKTLKSLTWCSQLAIDLNIVLARKTFKHILYYEMSLLYAQYAVVDCLVAKFQKLGIWTIIYK